MNQIREMVEQGFSSRKISHILKLNFDDVCRIIKENALFLKKEIFAEDQIPIIIDLYSKGISAKQLGYKYGIDKRRVQKWVLKKGMLRNKDDAKRIYTFNKNIFDNIDTPAKAYWLGFLYADAYNYENKGWLNIALKRGDVDHLEKFSRFMELKDYEIKLGTAELEVNGVIKVYETCSLKINSKYLSKKLKEIGCPQAKSFIIEYPKWLSPEFNNHFIRGMFDGDGSLSLVAKNKEWKWNLVSTSECCESIQNIIFDMIGIKINFGSISETNNNTFALSQGGNEKVLKIMSWLYIDADPSIYLGRKYQKYLDLIKQQDNRAFLKTSLRKDYFIPTLEKQLILDEIASNETIINIATKTIYQIKNK